MGLVYLAGPISGLSYQQALAGWRLSAEALLAMRGIKSINPMRFKDRLAGEVSICEIGYSGSQNNSKAIVTRDRNDIIRCDAVLMYLLCADTVSKGTMVELGWADVLRKPVVVVMEPEGNIHDHSFVREIAGWVVPTLDEAVDILNGVLHNG